MFTLQELKVNDGLQTLMMDSIYDHLSLTSSAVITMYIGIG